MIAKKASVLVTLFLNIYLYAQVGIGTVSPNASSLLDLQSSTKGVLVPRVSSAQRLAIASPSNSLLVFDTDANLFYYYSSDNLLWFPINVGAVKSTTATSYTLSASDNGRVLDFTSNTPVTLTVPTSLPVGFQVSITQAGTGSITVSAASGMTIQSRWGGTRSSGQWAKIGIEIRATGSAILSGDVQ